jgi:hypothetical protein
LADPEPPAEGDPDVDLAPHGSLVGGARHRQEVHGPKSSVVGVSRATLGGGREERP